MRRREFLKIAGSFAVTASARGLLGCGDDDASSAAARPDAKAFPQGVASGDPQATRVMLWTRVAPATNSSDPVALVLEVATDERFAERVVRRELEASPSSDYTVRVLVEDLAPDTIYYYRFSAGDAQSRVGRTWTAPAEDADVAVRFAWVSCQDYSAGFYGAYRKLINDDQASAADAKLRFVLHVGDFIYETRGEDFQTALDDDLQPITLLDDAGTARGVPPFPSPSGSDAAPARFARSVDDYRHLYKTFLSDPDLQEARARWPFVCVWDDHEFSDDCWQTQANYTRTSSTDEPSQQRKVAANQAWFEYIPATLIHDFEPVTVEDAPYTDPVAEDEPNNARALSSITIYRTLRFGQHVDLVLTDNRSYRSDHAVPEELTLGMPLIFHPRAALPLDVVNTFDAGRAANRGEPPEEVGGLPNLRRDSPPGTLLGSVQTAWWKEQMKQSSASFKVWGNSVPLVRVLLDTTNAPLFPGDLVLSADGWDGYPSARRELMGFLKDEAIGNVISLSGDHHAHFAGLVHDDFDADDPSPVMVDFAAAGISSQPQWSEVAGQIGSAVAPELRSLIEPVLKLIVYDATPLGGTRKAVVNLNTLIRYGSAAASIAAATDDTAMIDAARDESINPHLRYVDTGANGFGLASFDGSAAAIELVTIERPIVARGEQGAQERGRALFTVPRQEDAAPASMGEPELKGAKPFPLT
jgi:alkaline phosphatase D